MPIRSASHRLALLCLVLASCAPVLQAQPLVDGVTVGLGLTNYHGDLDWNPDNGPAEFIAASNLGVFVGADRSFGPVVAETALSYTRIDVDYPLVEMTLSTLGLDLTAGYIFDLFRPSFLRVYAGVAPLLVMPTYDRVDDARLESSILDFERRSTQVVWSFPVGIVIQDTFRLGLRFLPGDDFDGATGPSGASDLLSFLSVGYRVDLLRP